MAGNIEKHIVKLVKEKRFLDVDTDIETALENLEHILYKRATEKEITVDIKSHRIVNIPENDQILLTNAIEQSVELHRRFQEEGVMYKQEVATRQHLPDTDLAKWLHTLIRAEARKGNK